MEFNYRYMKKRFNIYINETEYKKILWLKEQTKRSSVNETILYAIELVHKHYEKKLQEQTNQENPQQ